MSPARDSMRTPSGARISSDRVGDSNLHNRHRHSYIYDDDDDDDEGVETVNTVF
jgi:hypothetical protein